MDRARFRDWVSSMDELTATQRREAAAVLSDPPEGEASLAAIELGVGEERRCPHCGTGGAVSRGKSRGLRRYRCKSCGRTFGALTGTALSGLHRKERWLSFAASLAEGETIRGAAARCGIAPSTAFRWRHRFLAAVRQSPDRLAGIVEADETFVLESRKGERNLNRRPRRRGGKARKRGLSREQVPILVAADRGGATLSRHPAETRRGQREAGAGAGDRPGRPARLRRRSLPSPRCRGARHSSPERQPLRRRAGARGRAHPDGQQSPQSDQGLLAALPRHRHQILGQLSEVVPSRHPRQASIAKSLSRGGQRQDMPAIRELSQQKRGTRRSATSLTRFAGSSLKKPTAY